MKQLYGYVDFRCICRVDDPNNYHSFFKVKLDGVWMVPPDDEMFRLRSPKELADLFQDITDFSRPLLPFPCTRKQFRDFLLKWHLDSDLDLDSEIWAPDEPLDPEKVYSIQEVAGTLRMPIDEIFKLFFGREYEGQERLTPAIKLDESVMLRRIRGKGGEEPIDGMFEISSIRNIVWDNAGYISLDFGGTSGVILSTAETEYIPLEKITAHHMDLCVLGKELIRYRRALGLDKVLKPHWQEKKLLVDISADTHSENKLAMTGTAHAKEATEEPSAITETSKKERPKQLDRTGSQGAMQLFILEGLAAYYSVKGYIPQEGQRVSQFDAFLRFVIDEYKRKPSKENLRPQFLESVYKLEETHGPKCICLVLKGKKGKKDKPYSRHSFETNYYKFKSKFMP